MPKALALCGGASGLAAVQKCHCLCGARQLLNRPASCWACAPCWPSVCRLLPPDTAAADQLPALCVAAARRCMPAATVPFCLLPCAAAQPSCFRRGHGSQAVQGAAHAGPATSAQLAPMHTAQPAGERTLRMALWAGSTRITSKYLYTASCGHGEAGVGGAIGRRAVPSTRCACKQTPPTRAASHHKSRLLCAHPHPA